MAKIGGTKSWVVAVGAALLLAFVVVPALSGAASATPAAGAAPSATAAPWAYGGQGWSNHTLTIGNTTVTWDAMFGWTVIFNATATAPNITMLEEQRTVGMTIAMTYESPQKSAQYKYHAQEVDVAFANITNQSTVYVSGQGVPALGLLNASASVNASLDQSFSLTQGTQTAGASLEVSGLGQAAVSFAPALGLVPLNLSGVSQWNSTAMASPSASWNISWDWAVQSPNGTSQSGSGSNSGNLSASGDVSLTGYRLGIVDAFHDHVPRVGIVLVIQGPFDVYDGFILVPHDFDLFGGAAQGYDSHELGSAGISAQTLYLSGGHRGLEVSAAATTFGSDSGSFNAAATTTSGAAPAATYAPGTTVVGQPMSVSQAQAENNALLNGAGSSGSPKGGAFLLGLLIAAVAVVVGSVGVVAWRASARRKSQRTPVGGYGPTQENGVPPGAVFPPTAQGPVAPQNGAPPVEEPNPPQ